MTTLWLDLETRSKVDLARAGVYVYAQSCNILLNSWAVDNGPVRTDDHLTLDFNHAFNHADRIVAHNAEFDRAVLSARMPDIRFDRWYCTMAQARRHGLPGGLDKLCDLLGVPLEKAKLKDGRALLMLFCKPNKDGTWNTKETHPEQWARFVQYGNIDVEAMREVHRRCPKWNDAYETPVWLADQAINARGFQVDLQFAKAAVDVLGEESERTDEEVVEATDGAVTSARQVKLLLDHVLSEHGVDLPDMQAATLERRIADPDLPDAVKHLLVLRQRSAKTSTSKYATFLRCASADGRVRGAITYSGAMRTKRWAGNRVQPHNMPRPEVGKLRGKALKTEIARGIDAVKAGVYDLIGTYPITQVLSSAVRGCIVPSPGKLLTVGDYSNVEGRGLAWLAGEGRKLQAFRELDAGEGPDLYKLAYSHAFGVAVDDVDDKQRQVGKVMELMLGYGGGVGAFVTGAATYRIDLDDLVESAWPQVPDDIKADTAGMWQWAVKKKQTYGLPELTFRTCDAIKRMWRLANPAIAQFWDDLETAVKQVLDGSAPRKVGMLTVDKTGAWLRIRLPSDSYISYPGARIDEKGRISYMGQNQYTRQWCRLTTYGGKLAENVTQALCRDLIAESLVNAEEMRIGTVLHVHDELVIEDGEEDDLIQCMTDIPWAEGLPLAVAAYTTDRYHKD